MGDTGAFPEVSPLSGEASASPANGRREDVPVVTWPYTAAGGRARAAAAERREEELHAALSGAGVDALELSTDDDLVDAIYRFADLRKRRSQLAAGGGMPSHLTTAREDREVPVA